MQQQQQQQQCKDDDMCCTNCAQRKKWEAAAQRRHGQEEQCQRQEREAAAQRQREQEEQRQCNEQDRSARAQRTFLQEAGAAEEAWADTTCWPRWRPCCTCERSEKRGQRKTVRIKPRKKQRQQYAPGRFQHRPWRPLLYLGAVKKRPGGGRE